MHLSDKDHFNTLTSLYATERADLANMGNQCLAIISLIVTYAVAVYVGLTHFLGTKTVSFLWFAAPIPILTFLAFYTLWVSLTIARTKSCKELEERIIQNTSIDAQDYGVTVSDRIMDVKIAPWRYKSVLLTAYGSIFLVGLSIVIYILIQGFAHHAQPWVLGVSIALYTVLLAPTVFSWFKLMHE